MYRWIAGGVLLIVIVIFILVFGFMGSEPEQAMHEPPRVGEPQPATASEPPNAEAPPHIAEAPYPIGAASSEPVKPRRPTLPPTGFDETFTSDIAFNAPEEIAVGSSVQISLALSPQSSGVAPTLALGEGLTGFVRTAVGVSAWPRMEAVLSGPDFDIEPAVAVLRKVLPDRPTQWDWTVRATRPGDDLPLTITLYGLFGHEEDPVHVKTFRETITVDATYWGMLTASAKDLTAVHGAVVAVGGSAFAIIGWLWTRRKDANPETAARRRRRSRPRP